MEMEKMKVGRYNDNSDVETPDYFTSVTVVTEDNKTHGLRVGQESAMKAIGLQRRHRIWLQVAGHATIGKARKSIQPSHAIFGDQLLHNLFRYPLTWLHNKASEVIMADKATMEHMMFLSTEAKSKKDRRRAKSFDSCNTVNC
nr:hypothetical protein [Tanacetum cinerariifolium]